MKDDPGFKWLDCKYQDCNYGWYSKSKQNRVTCPRCKRKTRVENIAIRKNAKYFLTDSDGKKHEFSAGRPHYYKNGKLQRFSHKIGVL